MKIKILFIATLLFSIYLTGCAKNNANNDNVAYHNRNGMEPTRVNYHSRNNGPVTGIDNTNPRLVTDVRDNRNINNNGKTRMTVADEAADRVTDLRDVDQANVIVTDNNAYVAAKLEKHAGDRLTNKIEKKISDRVKSVDRDIDNVYVSVNPDFYDRMTSYANDIRAGKPVSGFFDEFSRSVRRVFPDLK